MVNNLDVSNKGITYTLDCKKNVFGGNQSCDNSPRLISPEKFYPVGRIPFKSISTAFVPPILITSIIDKIKYQN